MAATQSDIERLRGLTQDLLERAQSGDWDGAVALESERRPLLYSVFGDVAPGTHSRHQSLLSEILTADREIMQLAQQRRDEVGGLLRQVGHGRSALKAYDGNRR
jgi:hypothetical protein